MSLLSLTSPVQAALPAAKVVSETVRALFGFGVLAGLLVMFKPLLKGMFRAAVLLVKPRESLQERSLRSRMKSVLTLNNMARRLEASEPGLAAELRAIAARG